MVAAMDVTLLVVDDAQCLLASRQRLDNPSEQKVMTQMDIRSLLSDITVVSAFDVLATMQLQADNERALERQQVLLKEIEDENELKTAEKSTKQAKNRKKKNKKGKGGSPKGGGTPEAERPAHTTARVLLVDSDENDPEQEMLHDGSLVKVPSDALSDSTDGTDDGLTQELERAITVADEDELHRNSGMLNNGWTIVTSPTRVKPGPASPPQRGKNKNQQQQPRRVKAAAAAKTLAPSTEDPPHKAEAKETPVVSTAATPDKKTAVTTKSKTVAPASPAVTKPSSPAIEKNKQPGTTAFPAVRAFPAGKELEWPQLESAGVFGGREKTKPGAVEGDSAEVAALQVESMMTGLAAEDEAIPLEQSGSQLDGWTSPVPGEVEAVKVNGTEQEQQPAITPPVMTPPAPPSQLWGSQDGTFGVGAPSFVPVVPGPPGPEAGAGPGPAAGHAMPPLLEGYQNFTVAFSVQGSGTISMQAPSGQHAIEQLQYLTSLQGGLSDLLSYAKCATMFQIVDDGGATD